MPSTGTGSLAVWVRSPDFPVRLNIYDPFGSIVGSDNATAGFTPAGDVADAAVNIQLSQTGSYKIEVTSSNSVYGTGRFHTYVSPGADLEMRYISPSGNPNPINVFGISSSNYVCICEDGGLVLFYNIGTQATTSYITSNPSWLNQTYGGCYSKQQDRVFVVGYDNNLVHDAVFEFDNTGSYIASYSTDPFTGNPRMCYDEVNDRIFIMRRNAMSSFGNARFSLWDCATRTIVGATSSLMNDALFPTAYCTYSDINNRYYISMTSGNSNFPMIWFDASNVNNSGSTTTTMNQFIQYVSGSNIIIGNRGGVGVGFSFVDPVTDTIVHSESAWYFESGASYDACSNMLVLAIDKNDFASNSSGLLVYDASYNITNFIPIQNTGNGEYTYGMSFVQTGSRLYITTGNYDSTSSLYSCKLSCLTSSITFVPTDEIILSLSSGSAILDWTFNSSSHHGFIIDRSSSVDLDFVRYAVISSSVSRSYTDSNVSTPNTYWYRATSFYTEAVTGSYSNSANIKFSVLGPELVVSGGFESGDLSVWTDNGGVGNVISGDALYVHTGTYGLKTGPVPMAFLSQIITTGIGNSYVFSFWLNGTGDNPSEVQVYWEGVQIDDITNPSTSGWHQFSYNVTATGPTSEIKLGLYDNPGYMGIDDISVR